MCYFLITDFLSVSALRFVGVSLLVAIFFTFAISFEGDVVVTLFFVMIVLCAMGILFVRYFLFNLFLAYRSMASTTRMGIVCHLNISLSLGPL